MSLEASITKYERAMRRALGQTNTTTRRIESRFAAMNRRLESGFVAFGRVATGAFAGAAALRGAQQLVDASTRIENALKVAGLSGADLTKVYDDLFASAQRNAAPLESLVTLYGRAAIVQKELGVTTEELLGFTDNVAVALRVAGTDAQSASGALLQLSQALGSGVVRAEEFNSILEGALPIAQAAASGLDEAGGSVAKLRALVVDGKVSSEAFFRAFEAGSVVLQQKVASAELTVSQGFVRLQNVLIDAAGRFNETTGAGQDFATFLANLGTKIEEISNSDAFNSLISGADEFGEALVRNTEGELQRIQQGIEAVDRALKEAFENTDVPDFALELAQAEQAMANLAQNTKGMFSPEVEAAFQDMIQQLLESKGSAELAEEAIIALGEADPSFAGLQASISEVIGRFIALRDAAIQANAAAGGAAVVPQGPRGRGRPVLSGGGTSAPTPTPTVSLSDYPISPGGGGGGSGGGGQSPLQRFEEALEQQRRRTEMLREETALQSTLNPLINDYGLAMERLRVQQELENEALEAGLELTPERVEAIRQLADGYAQATVEAARLAEAQELMQSSMSDFANAGQSALRGFIEDLRGGKSAAVALSNALNNVLGKVIDIGLNMVFGGFGGLFGIGFAQGGYTGNGGKYQPAGIVHGGEYVFSKEAVARAGVGNLDAMHRSLRGYANGGLVMPALPAPPGGGAGQPIRIALEVQEGAAFETRVLEVSGPASVEISKRSVQGYDREMPGTMSNYDARYR